MKITVTQDDIDKGKRENCMLCPISLSLKRLFPESHVETDIEAIYIGLRKYNVPLEAFHFIDSFDSGYGVSPFSFEIEGLEKELVK